MSDADRIVDALETIASVLSRQTDQQKGLIDGLGRDMGVIINLLDRIATVLEEGPTE